MQPAQQSRDLAGELLDGLSRSLEHLTLDEGGASLKTKATTELWQAQSIHDAISSMRPTLADHIQLEEDKSKGSKDYCGYTQETH